MSSPLFEKVFYTACSLFSGVLLWPILALADPEGLRTDLISVTVLFLAAVTVVVTVWFAPSARRPQSFAAPRSLRQVGLLVWAWLAAVGAVIMVWGALLLPAALIFGTNWPPVLVTLPAGGLIVALTWHVPAAVEDSPAEPTPP